MAACALQIAWQHAAEELREQYRREPIAQVRLRLHLLWLMRLGKKLSEAAHLVGASYDAARNWTVWYRQGGLEAVRARRKGNRKVGRCYLSAQQTAALAAKAKEGEFVSVRAVQAWVEAEFGVHYRYKGMWRLLHRLGWRPKVPRRLGKGTSLEAQEAWKKGA